MLRIAICDDESYVFMHLKELINAYCIKNNREFKIQYFSTAKELLEAPFDYSILFLDIMLDEGQDGIEIGMKLRQQKNSALFILITSRTDRTYEGYQAIVFRYLIKPLTRDILFPVLDSALDYLNYAPNIFTVKFKYHADYIPVKDIIYFESYYRKRYAVTQSNKFQTTETWEKIETQLEQLNARKHFFAPRRTYLINMQHVQGNSKVAITLSTGEMIKFEGEKKCFEFLKAFSDYLEDR